MAEEGNFGVARALEADGDSTKAEFHGRVEEARESIKESVSEPKENVVSRHDTVREGVTGVVDWREQVRKRPIACSLGALGVGLLVGYRVAGLIESADEPESERTGAESIEHEATGPGAFGDDHSYAANECGVTRVGEEHMELEQNRPGLIDRFKETRVYDRLQGEVSDLGNKIMDDLANTARSVVLPALLRKVKEIFIVDPSNKRPSVNTSTRRPVVTAENYTPTSYPDADKLPVVPKSESGKAAYPNAVGSLSKFDSPQIDRPAAVVKGDTTPHINLNYDDRYERESKLFMRGEDRGFSARVQSEAKPESAHRRGDNVAPSEAGDSSENEPDANDVNG